MGDRGWLSHVLVVTQLISYSLDGGTVQGFIRVLLITDRTTPFAKFGSIQLYNPSVVYTRSDELIARTASSIATHDVPARIQQKDATQ